MKVKRFLSVILCLVTILLLAGCSLFEGLKKPETYTVTFNSNGGSEVASVTVEEGKTIVKPTDPTRQEYSFGGWYKEGTFKNLWDFANDVVNGDITLHAKWSEIVVEDNNVVEPNTEVKVLEDTRDLVYGVYSATDNSLIEKFASLYQAINYVVNECDLDDYVSKIGDATKLFVNYNQYSEGTADMFWYYENGTSLAEYTPWVDSYWQDLSEHNAITVFKESTSGVVKYYANSHEIIGKNSNPEVGAGTVPVYNSCWPLEASVTVDLAPYSGITKGVYTVDLSEAKISPAYGDETKAWAYVGFITADAYNVSNQGLRCDTNTGNWYYYSGETAYDTNNIEVDTENCYLTSTWDETEQCFRPNGDVTLTMELLTLTDSEGDQYIVHRLTMDFGNGRIVVKDYEISELTQCGTVRFTSGLDIESDYDLNDYMCGAQFTNVVVTSAVGTAYPEMINNMLNYGSMSVLQEAGDYDLLNSNPESAARFHTIVYNPAVASADFSTPGKDIYSYSYKLNTNNPTLSTKLTAYNEAINALPEVENLTKEHTEAVLAARELYNALNEYQRNLTVGDEKLKSLEEELDVLAIPVIQYNYLDKNNQEANGENFEITIDQETGLYKFTQTFIQWGRVVIKYDGVTITTANISGAIGSYGDVKKLYTDGDDFTLLCWEVSGGTYIFTYDPKTSNLKIEAAREMIDGLSYSYDGAEAVKAAYDEATGNWTIIQTFREWGKINLFYDNVDVSTAEITVTGLFNSNGATWDEKLYVEVADPTSIYCCLDSSPTYKLVYNHEAKTLDISLHVEETEPSPEEALVYDYSKDELEKITASYDSEAGTYSFIVEMAQWGNVVLYYNNEQITAENTQISGDYVSEGTAPNKLYSENNALYYPTAETAKFKFVYDPTAKTLVVSLYVEETEPNLDGALVYDYSKDELEKINATFDSESGTYSFVVEMAQWGNVVLYYNEEQITAENTQISGDYVSEGSAPNKLYSENNALYYPTAQNAEFKFVYDPTAKTLVVTRLGFAYDFGADGIDEYLEANEDGTYTVSKQFAIWNRIILVYNGVTVTTDNTNVSGDYSPSSVANKLYTDPDGDNYTFLYPSSDNATFTLVYNPTNNTLVICKNVTGVAYDYSKDDSDYIAATTNEDGTYTIVQQMAQWGNLILKEGDHFVDLSSLTISGDYNPSSLPEKLYLENNKLYYPTADNGTFTLVYNPTNKTLVVCKNITGVAYDYSKDDLGYIEVTANDNGTYTITQQMAQWGSIVIKEGDHFVDLSSLTISGDYNPSSLPEKLYLENNKLYYPTADNATFTLVYDATNKTLTVTRVVA